MPGDDRYVALNYGPIVLSGALGREGLDKFDFWRIPNSADFKAMPESKVLAFIARTAGEILERIQPDPRQPLPFWATGLTRAAKVRLIPFDENHFQRYAI
jgi:uncharacterized protein